VKRYREYFCFDDFVNLFFSNALLLRLSGWWWLNALELLMFLQISSNVGYGVRSGFPFGKKFHPWGWLPFAGHCGNAETKWCSRRKL
jgi:hypothetical protein